MSEGKSSLASSEDKANRQKGTMSTDIDDCQQQQQQSQRTQSALMVPIKAGVTAAAACCLEKAVEVILSITYKRHESLLF